MGPVLLPEPHAGTTPQDIERAKAAAAVLALLLAARVFPRSAAPIARYGFGIELGITGEIVGAGPLAPTNALPQPFGFVPPGEYGLEPDYYLPRGDISDLSPLLPGYAYHQERLKMPPPPPTSAVLEGFARGENPLVPNPNLSAADAARAATAARGLTSLEIIELARGVQTGQGPSFFFTNPSLGAAELQRLSRLRGLAEFALQGPAVLPTLPGLVVPPSIPFTQTGQTSSERQGHVGFQQPGPVGPSQQSIDQYRAQQALLQQAREIAGAGIAFFGQQQTQPTFPIQPTAPTQPTAQTPMPTPTPPGFLPNPPSGFVELPGTQPTQPTLPTRPMAIPAPPTGVPPIIGGSVTPHVSPVAN